MDYYLEQISKDILNPSVGIMFLNEKLRSDMVKYSFIKPTLRVNWQEMIYDCEGRIIMQAYQKCKELHLHYLSIIDQQSSFN